MHAQLDSGRRQHQQQMLKMDPPAGLQGHGGRVAAGAAPPGLLLDSEDDEDDDYEGGFMEAPGSSTIVVEASSGGWNAGNFAQIKVNGEKVKLRNNSSGHDRGLHLVVIDQKTGEVTAAQVFDTYQSSDAIEKFISSDGVPQGSIVVAACKDDFQRALSANCTQFFEEKMNSREISKVQYRHGYVFMGILGGAGAVSEKRAQNPSEKVTITQVFMTQKEALASQNSEKVDPVQNEVKKVEKQPMVDVGRFQA